MGEEEPFNLFCIYGFGVCPAPKPPPEPEPVAEPEPTYIPGFSLFSSGPLILDVKGSDTAFSFTLKLDLVVALLLCTICSSVVATLITYWMVNAKAKKARAEPGPVNPANTPSDSSIGDDEDGVIKVVPQTKSMLDFAIHGVGGYYQRPTTGKSQPPLPSKIPIFSGAYLKDSLTVILKKSLSLLTEAEDGKIAGESGSGVAIPPSAPEGSIAGVIEKQKQELKFKSHVEKFTERIRPPKSDYSVLTLHQYPRGRSIPCMAPHGMKIESLLRLCGIQHKVVFDADSTGPWLSYGDLKVCGGVQMCIKFLEQTFPRKMKCWSVPMKKKVPAWFVLVLTDCHLYWGLTLWRWWIEAGKDPEQELPDCDVLYGDSRDTIEAVRVASWLHGIGQMSQNDIVKAVKQDLLALATSLAHKKYFIGDSMTEVDCSVFSLVSQMVWASNDSPFRRLVKKYPSLIRFCENIRRELWEDWEAVVVDSSSQLATVPSKERPEDETKSSSETKAQDVSEVKESHESRRSHPNQVRFTDKISIKSSSQRKRSSKSQTRRSTLHVNPLQSI